MLKYFCYIPAGHLTFQCYNTVAASAGGGGVATNQSLLAVSSTSSDSEEDLAQLEALIEQKKKIEIEKSTYQIKNILKFV